ncbi:hypothetical protein AYO21_11300 [Fonsecaea monophora]|uniref:RNase MRP protein 1 RNA binding domain-containing protein n=1 Tax=Fonsecaea monophora TaxID=254056 RepID=A0A177ERH5_9EURO|nr:hypothetical protein AYO21_11300 [Fonsecaea monophora]KAH0846543.1 hypothetical protein FOPE_11859 [Fonsecaea pedrosoi]OAG34558.1 hypothetical protein AYO21_11300 [Fonsecaea monophora]
MGQKQQPDARRSSIADADMAKSKRRKLSHPQRGSHVQAQGRSRAKDTRRMPRKRRLGPHPPRDLRHQIGQAKPETGLPTPPGTSNGASKFTLSFAKSILDKIWIRNKNQHRTQPWWKSLSMLRKAVFRLVLIEQEELSLRGRIGQDTANAKAARERFERETQLRREKEIWADWARQTLVPRAYLGFSGLVSDSQFAHLGVVLVGLLADVVSSVGLPTPIPHEQIEQRGKVITTTKGGQSDTATTKARSPTAKSIRVTGLQSGEIVERTYDSDDLGEVIERKRRDHQQDLQPSRPTTRTWPDGASDRDATLVREEERAVVMAGSAPDRVAGTDTKNPKRKAERSAAPSPSPSAPLTAPPRDPATDTASHGSSRSVGGAAGLDLTDSTFLEETRGQTTRAAKETRVEGKTKTRDNSGSSGSSSNRTKKSSGKGKKNAIDDLFAGLT